MSSLKKKKLDEFSLSRLGWAGLGWAVTNSSMKRAGRQHLWRSIHSYRLGVSRPSSFFLYYLLLFGSPSDLLFFERMKT